MKGEKRMNFFIMQFRRCFMAAFAVFIISAVGIFSPKSGECQESVSTLKDNTFFMAINRPETEPYYTWIEMIYREVFTRLDIRLKTKYYPLMRASYVANKGQVDGEPARIYSYADSYPNLLRVEESVFPITVTAYMSASSDTELKGWESLRNTEYTVEYPRGMKICENNLKKVVKAELLSDITETSQGLRKLAFGRIDIYVDDMNAAIPVLQNKEFDVKEKVRIAGVMEEVPLYMYVHKKHQALSPKLAAAIRELKSEGMIEKYRKTAFGISEQ